MTMPTDIGAVDLMIGFPVADHARTYDYLRPMLHDAGSGEMELPAEYMFKDVPNQLERGRRPRRRSRSPRWTSGASTSASIGARPRGDRAGAARSPRSLRRQPRGRPERHHRHGAQDPRRRTTEHGIKAVTTFPAGCNPQVPVNDRRYYPIYQTCIDLDIPIISNAGIAGPAVPVGVPGRHALRRGLLRLPRAAHRDAPRRRAVGGARGEAHAQVAEPLLHDERVRAQVLPEGDHRLRQHARRRQGHVRRLLPDGPEPRAHLHRDARTCRSATTCGRSSCARTRSACSSSTAELAMRRIEYAGSVHDEEEIDAVVEVLRGGVDGAAHRQERARRSSRASPSCSASAAASCATPARRRSTSRSSCSGCAPGDEVITSAVTFSTDIAPLVRAGLVPVFVDVEPDTYNIDVDAHRGDDRAAHARRSSLPNLIGNAPDWDRIRAIADAPRPHGDRGLVRRARRRRCGARPPARAPTSASRASRSRTSSPPPAPAAWCCSTTTSSSTGACCCGGGAGAPSRSSSGRRRATGASSPTIDGLEYDNLFIFDEVGWNFEPSRDQRRVRAACSCASCPGILARRQRNFRLLSEYFATHPDVFVLPAHARRASTPAGTCSRS